MKNTTIRADKLLSSLGLISRRGVEQYIKTHNVTADGTPITQHGQRVGIKSIIKVNGSPLKTAKKVYYLLNKPKGIVSTSSDELGRKNVVSLVPKGIRVYPVGRLDKDTHGLLILTNDGELTNSLIHPRYHIGKKYQLIVRGQIAPSQIELFEKGVTLDDGTITSPAIVRIRERRKNVTVCELTIFEGKKRQIRRMCEALNLALVDLERIQFGFLTLDGVSEGGYRHLTGKEVEKLRELVK